MATSQNGYPANNESLTALYTIPGTTIKLKIRKGACATVLLYVAAQFHKRVENLNEGHSDEGCYVARTIRGSSTLSNHASGTAIDLNWSQHPLGTSPSANFSAKQIAEIRAIVKECGGVIRWGGDYTGRKDGMHFEIVAAEAKVAVVAAKLSGAPAPAKPVAKPVVVKTLKQGSSGAEVRKLQLRLGITADGLYGKNTAAAVARAQKARGLTADGIAGPKTRAALGV